MARVLLFLLVAAALMFQPGHCEEETTCKVSIRMTKEVPGKCVRLHGNRVGCVADGFLDVANADCFGMR
ncbi:hypothetical protein QR680_002242 [Steinernema hermaphroditum]|uniref:Uncharacterized protein n=1 Tax=Steinernema hermaphroditum TaxID=289476 RepID=A0AA39LHV4_9BILA|nr:hypothetical protein QR680_002242 [Steinernema hermaphroditum]